MLAVADLDAQQSAVFDNSLTVDLTHLDIFAFCSENVVLCIYIIALKCLFEYPVFVNLEQIGNF